MDRLAELLEDILNELKQLNAAVERIGQQSFETGLELQGLANTVGGDLHYNIQDLHGLLSEISVSVA